MAIVEFYPPIKTAHVRLALASGSLFVSRGVAMLVGWTLGMRAPVRYLSYVIDTALLGTALLLLAVLCLNLFATPWLAAKLALFVAYIVFGSLALKRARIRPRSILAFAAALFCFVMMYSIARQHEPLGFLRLLEMGGEAYVR